MTSISGSGSNPFDAIDGAGALDGPDATGAADASAAAATSGDPARTGWSSSRAPNGRVLPFDVSRLDEDALLRPGKKAALYALGSGPADFHPDREPVILVHGINGDPKNLQALAKRLEASGEHQVYVLCYDDDKRRTSLNGVDFAEELRSLTGRLGAGRDVEIVAHSMGGIVARRALNELAIGPGRGIEKLGQVRFTAVDTPWHGYDGPADSGIGGFMMGFVRPFMPDGLEDMRAASSMFQGDPGSRNPAAKAPLLDVELPDNVTTDLVFAAEGKEVEDYSEGALAPLAGKLVGLYKEDAPVKGDARLANFWKAMIWSSAYGPFSSEMRDLADAGKLDEAKVLDGLRRYFPKYPGGHDGVLGEQPGQKSFLDAITKRLIEG